MKTLRNWIIPVTALGISLLGAIAFASSHVHSHATKRPTPTGKITPWAAMKIAEGKSGGHALGANFEFDDGQWIYGVMVVTGGHLKEVEINPTTGAVGEIESATPAGEAKELASDLTKALKG